MRNKKVKKTKSQAYLVKQPEKSSSSGDIGVETNSTVGTWRDGTQSNVGSSWRKSQWWPGYYEISRKSRTWKHTVHWKETDRTSSDKAQYLLTHYRLWDYMLKAFPVRFTALIRNLIYTGNTVRTVNQGWRAGWVRALVPEDPSSVMHIRQLTTTFNSSSRSDCPLPTSAIWWLPVTINII